MIYKKGAMFGLDARIALAIFGALSVISGAALFSAIQQAKTVSTHQEFIEIFKAIDAYYLDTGVLPPFTYYLSDGTASVPSGWNGPYITKVKNGTSIESETIENAKFDIYKTDENLNSCSSGEACTLSLYMVQTSDSDAAPAVYNLLKDMVGSSNNYKVVSANIGAAEGTPRYHYFYIRGGIPLKI